MINTTATAQWNIGSNCGGNWWCIVVPVWAVLIIMRTYCIPITLDRLSHLRFLWALICLVRSIALVAFDWGSLVCVIHIPSLGIDWCYLVHRDMLISLNNVMTEVTHVLIFL